jgi:hypothetical protein
MKRSTKKVTVALMACIIMVLLLADEYPAMRFRGDGKFSGGPIFGYRIEMRAIPFYQAGEYRFHFRGVPDEEMSLLLDAGGMTNGNREVLTHLGTTLDALLVDQNGRVVCKATGMPREGQNEHIWVVMSGGLEATFWHWNCVNMPLKPSASYTLDLRIANVDPKTPRVNLLPVIQGGQLDLP